MNLLAVLIQKRKRIRFAKIFLMEGVTTQYAHQATVSYNVPMQKIPLLDWTTLRASYGTQYNWLTASNSQLARNLGNILSNTQTRTVNGELNFDQLYAKSRFLRAINTAPVNDNKKNAADTVQKKKTETKTKSKNSPDNYRFGLEVYVGKRKKKVQKGSNEERQKRKKEN